MTHRPAIVIDEEKHFRERLESSLRIAQYDVDTYRDAYSAYVSLCNGPLSADCRVFIDMFLLPGTEEDWLAPSSGDTEYSVGLHLFRKLADEGVFSRMSMNQVVLYTTHNIEMLWTMMMQAQDQYKVTVVRKYSSEGVGAMLERAGIFSGRENQADAIAQSILESGF